MYARKPRRTIAHLGKTVLVRQVRTTKNNPLLPFGRDLKLIKRNRDREPPDFSVLLKSSSANSISNFVEGQNF